MNAFEQAEKEGRLALLVGTPGNFTDCLFPMTLARMESHKGKPGHHALAWPTKPENTGKAGILDMVNSGVWSAV